MNQFRVDRTLLLETDPVKTAPQPLTSIKEATWQHQKAAMVAGYNSVADMAIDEILAMLRDHEARLSVIEDGVGEVLPDRP